MCMIGPILMIMNVVIIFMSQGQIQRGAKRASAPPSKIYLTVAITIMKIAFKDA